MWRVLTTVSCLVALTAFNSLSSAAEPDAGAAGVLPVGSDGKMLNLDLERGDLADWLAEGEAFKGQPIKGDTVFPRRSDMHSHHRGEFWIGTFEVAGDQPQGTLTSAPFKVTKPFAAFLVAGGPHAETRVELVRRDSGKVIVQVSGDETEELKPVAVDLSTHLDQEIFIRLVDQNSGGWGHINFDDFKLYDKKPNIPPRGPTSAAEIYLHAGLSGEEAAQAMTVPDGFKVTLFAAEPDVQQPIALALDDRGRLWIAEAYSYPVRRPDEEAKDRILIFEDTDGDGHFDTRKVFAEKLNLISGMELGFGGVWVGAAPYLLFIPDKDHDDVPDGPPQVLLDGWGHQDTHETLNSFMWGPDGWLYGCHGVFTYSLVGKPGTPESERTPLNAGIWRYHPTKHAFEVFAQGTSNPWGVDFNDQGQAFCTACVIPHLFHIIQGARYQRQAGDHFNPYTYADIQTIAEHRHWVGNQWRDVDRAASDSLGGGHAHAGAMLYLGAAWPEKYKNQIFMNNVHGQRVNQDLLEPKGSGYRGTFAPDFLLSNDRWSQMLNFRYGPDGQVYVIDWYDKQACHTGNPADHDRSNGRIFKISYGEPKPVKVDLRKRSDAELAKLQLEPNDWYVRHARRLLQERAPAADAKALLLKVLRDDPDETRRLRAMWALHAIGGFSEEAATAALKDGSPYVRGWAIQLLLENSPADATLLARLAEMAQSDSSPVVRLYLSSAVQRLPAGERWNVLAGLVGHAEDAGDHNLPLMYWYGMEPLADADAGRFLTLALRAKVPLLLSFSVRRLASAGGPEAIANLVSALDEQTEPAVQLRLLAGINEAFQGRRQVEMPKNWPAVFQKLNRGKHADVRRQATALAITFGDPGALTTMREALTDEKIPAEVRAQALASLLGAKDPKLAPVLHALVRRGSLRGPALRALAAYDDAATPEVLLGAYAELPQPERRDALATLAARVPYARKLLNAVEEKQVAAADLSAELLRQLRNLHDEEIDRRIGEVWGVVRETAEDKAKMIEQYKALLAADVPPPDKSHGRAVFVKTCSQCHTLFGAGGKVGPELTGANRGNQDYLLSNILDPSAVMAKEYMPSIIATTDGRIITGIVRQQNEQALTVVTQNDTLTIPRNEIDEMEQSTKSMMPDDILKPLAEADVRSLVAYLGSPGQVPLEATPENLPQFFNGNDLAGWQGNPALWSVDNGEIVGRTSGLERNEFLASELLLGDFRLTLSVKLAGNEGNSGVQFRSEPLGDGEVKGYQADIGAGWWGKLYEEHGRGLLWDQSGEAHVRNGEWNTYEIVAEGNRIRTWINGQPCVDLDDPPGAKRGVVALQLHSGGPTEVHFKDFKVELLP